MIIHQALHGYSQGHNRLASSFPLLSQDDDRMKMLSDWSEYSGNNDNSYITTYPLSDSRHYVVAKSWYADDMNRPGCVWTHSLIIDLAELDENFDFRTLNSLFKRPNVGEYESYSEIIHYIPLKNEISKYAFAEDMLIWLYVNLVNQDIKMLYRIEQNSVYYQSIILTMLQYLPLDILKNIAMCSGSAYGRKTTVIEYNLQFAVSMGESLSVVVKNAKDSINRVCEGVKSICHSMILRDSDTDEVLRVFSNDIGDSPFKLCGVGLLLKYLDIAIGKLDNTPSFSCVLHLLSDTFPSKTEGKMMKMTFCKKNISNLFSPEYVVLADMAIVLPDEWLDFNLMDYTQRVSALKENVSLDKFIKYLTFLVDANKLNALGNFVLRNSDQYLNQRDYSYISQQYWTLYMSLVKANSGVLKYSFWVDFIDEHFIPVYDVFKEHYFADFDAWSKLFLIVLYRNHTINKNIMDCFVKHVPNITFEIMEYLNKSIEYKLNPLLCNYCANHITDILSWLKMQKGLTLSTITFLVNYIDPKSKIVKDIGSDVWKVFGKSRYYEQSVYYIFLFILGHLWSDANALQFIKRSFYPIYVTLSKNMLPDDLWWKIEPYTAKLNFFKEWDKCKKIKKGTIQYLKDSGFSKSVLNNFTPDDVLNESLKNIWDKELQK